jgi:hypothetical protein
LRTACPHPTGRGCTGEGTDIATPFDNAVKIPPTLPRMRTRMKLPWNGNFHRRLSTI